MRLFSRREVLQDLALKNGVHEDAFRMFPFEQKMVVVLQFVNDGGNKLDFTAFNDMVSPGGIVGRSPPSLLLILFHTRQNWQPEVTIKLSRNRGGDDFSEECNFLLGKKHSSATAGRDLKSLDSEGADSERPRKEKTKGRVGSVKNMKRNTKMRTVCWFLIENKRAWTSGRQLLHIQ